jgi:ATP-binding cassette, subfamily B, multidrug efflux pump
MYKPNSGTILVNQLPLRQYDLAVLRNNISYVPQEVFLFSDTIKNNINFGLNETEENKPENVAKTAMIYDEIMQFSDGFETIVGERGVTLSGGQKQRISIARALIKNAELYIFDDCLSAVDIKTESGILNNLNQALNDKTSIFVTHRLFGLMEFDKIIVMDNGAIAETGTHEILLNKKGLYYELYIEQQKQNI